MSTMFVDSTFAAAVWIAVKATGLLAVAAVAQALIYRRTSAATRHLVWMLAIVGILMLPLLGSVLPEWQVPIRSAPAAIAHSAPVDARIDEPAAHTNFSAPLTLVEDAASAAPRLSDFSWWTAIGRIYFLGMIAMLLYLIAQQWQARRMARHATVVRDADWLRQLADCAGSIGVRRPVRLLRSREQTMPMAFGTRRPSIMIPAIADSWSDDRRRAVMLHELAHVARYDCLTQALVCAACALYWMHPLAWWVARRLRIERELACDDRVLNAGTEAREYAGHLLEIAYSSSGHRAPALAVGMARSRQLESRMLAALDTARNRKLPGSRARLAGVAIAGTLLAALAAARPTLVASASEAATLSPASSQDGAQPSPVRFSHLKEVRWPLQDLALRAVHVVETVLGVAQEIVPGTWELRPTGTTGIVHLTLRELGSSSGSNIQIEQLDGLSAGALAGPGGPITFQLKRDAGTFMFEGILRGGVAAGTFSYKADLAFPAELAKRGFTRPTPREQYQLARHNVGYAFVDELSKQGYTRPQTSELVRAGEHGVNETYLREMGALRQRLGTLEALITLRDHGVTPGYIRDLEELGYKGLSADALRNARDHGISADYVRGMRDAGYGALPLDELINARDHGVSPEFVRALGDEGHRTLSLEQVIAVRDHGISPEYAREMRQLGHALSIDKLIDVRDHGVSADFVRAIAALGYSNVPIDSLVRLRDHGVTPQYVQDLKALGYDRLAIDDLIMLRDHGLTPERIRAANARAGSRLPIDMLKALAAGGLR